MTDKEAIVVVDALNDFIDGSMACLNARQAVDHTVALILSAQEGSAEYVPAYHVCDHHPADHCSFAAQGGPWPPHCVQGTRGAEIDAAFAAAGVEPFPDELFYKGDNPSLEEYSGAHARGELFTLTERLRLDGIETVHITGIATEYCVLNTARDLREAGFEVVIHVDCLGYVTEEGHRETLRQLAADGYRII